MFFRDKTEFGKRVEHYLSTKALHYLFWDKKERHIFLFWLSTVFNSRVRQVLHQRWIGGNHRVQATTHTSRKNHPSFEIQGRRHQIPEIQNQGWQLQIDVYQNLFIKNVIVLWTDLFYLRLFYNLGLLIWALNNDCNEFNNNLSLLSSNEWSFLKWKKKNSRIWQKTVKAFRLSAKPIFLRRYGFGSKRFKISEIQIPIYWFGWNVTMIGPHDPPIFFVTFFPILLT